MLKWFKKQKDNPKSSLSRTWRFIELLDERIERHHTFMQASGIAFNILLYLLPMFLIAVLGIRLFLGEQGIVEVFTNLLLDMLPPTEGTYSLIETIKEEVELLVSYSSVFGIIGAFVLLWLSSTLISSFRSALNTIFNISSPHVFILYRFKDMLLIIVITVLIFIYSYAVPIIAFLQTSIGNILPEFLSGVVSEAMLLIFSLLTTFSLLYFIFRWVPNKKIPRKPRLFATGMSVILIELARYLFAWYISSVSNYGRFYGTYAVIVAVAIWVYYSSLIILLSAELGKFLYDIKWYKGEEQKKIDEKKL